VSGDEQEPRGAQRLVHLPGDGLLVTLGTVEPGRQIDHRDNISHVSSSLIKKVARSA